MTKNRKNYRGIIPFLAVVFAQSAAENPRQVFATALIRQSPALFRYLCRKRRQIVFSVLKEIYERIQVSKKT